MKKPLRPAWKFFLLVCLLLASVLFYTQSRASTAGGVTQAWNNVRLSDSYAVSADVAITSIPLATAGNIGRFSKTDRIYLEGVNDQAGKSLQLALWGGGVNAADRASAYQMRVSDQRVETRMGDGPWQTSNDATVAFAPGGDFLAFAQIARNVTPAPDRKPERDDPACKALDCSRLAVYTFDLDSRAYAAKLRDIAQAQMVRNGTLPVGATIQLPEHLSNISGSGELWVDGRGLPVREKVQMAIPAAAGADSRTETEMDIRFSDYQGYGGRLAGSPWLGALARRASRALPSAPETAASVSLSALVLLVAALVVRPGRRTRMTVTVAALVMIVAGPALQASAATTAIGRANTQQAAQAASQDASEKQQEAQATQAALRTAPPYTPPTALAPQSSALAPQAATIDTDADGLTDATEALVGANPYSNDTDDDGVSDYAEVTGFTYGGKTWYGNPLWADSNGDGASDGLEWNTAAPDSDGDGTPDLWDYDDDGDAAPDNIDVSRLTASKDDAGNLITFSASSPLTLTVDSLDPNRYTFVDLQLRPTNPNQLWYAFNVLNWPHDEKGNMQDWDNKTLFDICRQTGGTDCKMTPDDNGDIKLVPMLEVAVSDLSNLPRTAGGALDKALLDQYGIAVQQAGNGGYYLYAPLTLVEDSATGAKVAFNAHLLYQAGASWKPQQVRLSWAVQALNETYASADAAKAALKAGNGTGNDTLTVLHAYYADFYLTGVSVREERGVDMAIAYEDPATDPKVNEDDALVQLMHGLDSSYLISRDCDFVDNAGTCVGDGQRDITIATIKQRWDRLSNTGITEGQRWGIPANRLRVETYSFSTAEEATMVAGGQYAPAILNAHFTGTPATKPSLLFARETRFRGLNADARAGGSGSIAWTGRNVRLDLAGMGEIITGGYNLAPYQYVSATHSWTRQTPQEYVSELEKRYPVTASSGNTAPTVTEGEQIAVVLNNTSAVQGNHTVLSQNGNSGLGGALTGNGTFVVQGVDLTDDQLRQTYLNAVNSAAVLAARLALSNIAQITGLTDAKWNDLVKVIDRYNEKLKPVQVSENLNNQPKRPFDPVNGSSSFDSLGEMSNIQKISTKDELKIKFANSATAQRRNSVLIFGGLLAGIFLTNIKGAQTAGEIMLGSVSAAASAMDAGLRIQDIVRTVNTLPKVTGVNSVLPYVLSWGQSLRSVFGAANAVGLVIGVGVSWGLFFAAWGSGKVSVNSVEFNSLLAGALSAIPIAVLTLVLSLSIVGVIVLAIVAVFDLIALIICKIGVKAACSLGVMEALTKMITDWIYTGGVMIDTKADPAITNIEDAQLRLTNPEKGLVAGNSTRFAIDLYTLVRHAAPEPGIIYHYDDFFTAADLQSTTVTYSLDATQRKLKADLNQSWWLGPWAYSYIEAEVPSPVVGWLVPTTQSKTLWAGQRSDKLVSPLYQFSSAQINQVFPLYLNTGLALPRYDCWFQICVHKAAKSTVSTDLGKQFVLDILPATLDQFAVWSQLGSQIDPDGDGLGSKVDPDQTKFDTDGDGVSDGIEYQYGVERGYGFDPRKADADGDGLNDADEMRFFTDPRKADSDGDGVSDFDEVRGYDAIISGQTVRVWGNPRLADTDGDGMSDGVERRLNTLNPTAYPFAPAVVNTPPVRLYTGFDDLDRVYAVSQSATVTTTVVNGTAAADSLVASGVFSATLPAQLGGATQTRNFSLLPTSGAYIVLTGAAAHANGVFDMKGGAAAGLAPAGSPSPSTFTDIILNSAVPVTIDNDAPDAPALTVGDFVQPGRTVIVGGTASDPTSYISRVEVSINGGAFSAATGASLWSYPVDIPNLPSGSVPLTVRDIDAVGNTNTASPSLTIDGVSPTFTVDLNPGDSRRVRRNADGAWTLPLSGTVTDTVSGIGSLTFQIADSSNQTITSTVVLPGGSWSFDYPFDNPAFNTDPRPTGNYTLTVTARDNALPDGNPRALEIPFTIDMTPPTVTQLAHKDDTQLTDGSVITGTVSDANSAVTGVEIAFVSAQTALGTERTLLNLPLNDLPKSLQFANPASAQTRVYCLDVTCPTSGVPGEDGTAAQFSGGQLLRTFDALDLPESGLTTALWFKTSCANCGLLTVTQGAYPALVEHDRDLFLDGGKVCSSILTGAATREIRCSAGNGYANGQWHQVVSTLGVGGNALYVDGQLAVSSPTTASSFGSQDGLLVGYSPAAATPFLTGVLDDVAIYDSALAPASAAALYRQWQPVTFSGNTWSYPIPADLEGYYQIDMRATDSAGNRAESRGDWPKFRGPIDTKAPTFDLNVTYSGSGSAAQTTFSATVRDANLTTNNYSFVCELAGDQLRYTTDPTQLAFTGQPDTKLTGITAQCAQPGFQDSLVSARACDAFGHCAAGVPPQTVAYIGTQANALNPTGSLPNAIERTVLSNPQGRAQIIARPGKLITDIALDDARGKIYWAEMQQGSYAQPAQIWRANLDGSAPTLTVDGLTAYAPEALQIAVDTVGNKLYWTKGDQLWWANLDGSLQAMVYQVAGDPRISGGNHGYQHIGDVMLDQKNSRIYLAERRWRLPLGSGFGIYNHSLLVQMDLNGASPSFVAGAGAGCTYANYGNNLGAGVGAGQQPSLCLEPSGGIDIQSIYVANSKVYWAGFDSASAADGKVYSVAPGNSPTLVAPLGLTGSSQGLRTAPLPHLYVAPDSVGVFVANGKQVLRGEPGGEFTVFGDYGAPAPTSQGLTTRAGSSLTAMAVMRVPQTVQTKPDLAVGLTSPDIVLVNGQTGRYSLDLRNNSALPTENATVALTLPAGATFDSASGLCSATGADVTCDLGRFDPQARETLVISFTVSATSVQTLTALATVSSPVGDANQADNSASQSGITAAPTLAALPGIPYLYASNLSNLYRIPLAGSNHAPEPVLLDNSGVGGKVIASDTAAGKLIISNAAGKIATVNPDGTGYTIIGDTNPNLVPPQDDRLSVAVDETTGRVYWTELVSIFLSNIVSADLDGSDKQTVVPNVLNQRGLTVDPIRRKLLWVGSDSAERQDVIYRSNLDGAQPEIVYAAPVGRQVRYLAVNSYNQKLYWIDGTYDAGNGAGALFWADSDGNRVAALRDGLGSQARGLVVRPLENTIYFTSGTTVARADLDGGNYAELTTFDNSRYYGVSNLDPTVFPYLFLSYPDSNLVLALGTPFAPATCATADMNEPNDTATQAKPVSAGSFTAALCRSTSAPGQQDQDVYKVTVPSGQQVDVTLNPPADYNLYLRQDDFTLDVSANAGNAAEHVTVANYDASPQDYTFTVYSPDIANSPAAYAVTVALSAAPPQTVFTDAQCATVDSYDQPGLAGNGSQANASPITVGTPITAALCYQNDIDFYKFSGVAGRVISVNLPARPADYPLYVYRPNGTLFNAYSATGAWTYGTSFTLDATGDWAVAVADANLTPTMSQYQLVVTDSTCGINDSQEPNDVAGLAAVVDAKSRVFATLCSASDVDYYQLTVAAGQQLTVNYPANATGASLTLQDATGTALGQVSPGTQGLFTLANAGAYRLVAARSSLTGQDVPYMFQWRLAAPAAPSTATSYVYYGDFPHLDRVALTSDHTVEPILIDGGASGGAIATSPALGKVFLVDGGSQALESVNFDGTNRSVIIPNANPDGVGTINIAVAVDDLAGRVYWLQPQGAVASAASKLMAADVNGANAGQILADLIYNQNGLTIDPVKGLIYWVAGSDIHRANLDGTGATLVRAAGPGETVRDLAVDPFSQQLYWLDPPAGALVRAASDGTGATALITGLASDARGIVVRPLNNELYYSSGTSMMRATLAGTAATAVASLSGTYAGPSNLDPGAFLNTPIGKPASNLAFGQGSPIVNPCSLADTHEPNNSEAAATPLSGYDTAYGALCNSTTGQSTDEDYYSVTVPDRQSLTATLTELPADYRLVILHPDGYAAAFSDTPGLVDETGVVTNTSGAAVTYTVLVLAGYPVQNTNQYQLSLSLADVPIPNPDDAACSAVDAYDAPAPGGNGTLASATPLVGFGTPIAAALCYTDDVDMYAFQGVAGQTISINLPTRPQDYTLTLYDPSGAGSPVSYGAQLSLAATGSYTVSVSQPGLTPTADQYQLVVTDQNCAGSDANEPNDDAAHATAVADGSRVRGSLCQPGDADTFHITGAAGQQLTVNYPANATGAEVRVLGPSGALGTVAAGTQGQFTLPEGGVYTLSVANTGLTGSNVPYRFQVRLGEAVPPPSGSPYVYYSRAVDLIRADAASGAVEPLLIADDTSGGPAIASDPGRGWLYILDNFRRVSRVRFDGTGRAVIVPTVNPNDLFRPTESLAVDEASGRIYWTEASVGVVVRILSANGDGSDVQEINPLVRYDHGLAVDSIAGQLYWVEVDTYHGIEIIQRSNLDGSGVERFYEVPAGREARDLAIDPFSRKLYWRDPTQNLLLWMPADGGAPTPLAAVGAEARGFVLRPLEGQLYYTDGATLYRAALDGSDPVALARLEGAYNGVSNLDANVFYPTVITPPESNLALGYGAPFSQPCNAVDAYEPNDTLETAAAIGTGAIQAALCEQDYTRLDMNDYYATTVAAGQAITVSLTDLPQHYGLWLLAEGALVASSNPDGTGDRSVTHTNSSSSPVSYAILVGRAADTTSTKLQYTLSVSTGAPPPPPPPPPSPADECAAVDPYDAPGAAGNGSRSRATLIGYNTPINAALCYNGDQDYYAFDGVIGQNIRLNMPVRPVDYYMTVYDPAGNYVTGIFPGSSTQYGDYLTLKATGRWTVAVWDPNLAPTADQYQLSLSMNTSCYDPYPNNHEQGSTYQVLTPTVTLKGQLCLPNRQEWFTLPVQAGDRVNINPATLAPGVTIWRQQPNSGFYEEPGVTSEVMSASGDYNLEVFGPASQDGLPYQVDVEVIPAPSPTPLPNNWSCAVYTSNDVPRTIEDLVTFGSAVSVAGAGTVTHVDLQNVTYSHKLMDDLEFGLQSPDGTVTRLFRFDATNNPFFGCGSGDCNISFDDAAVEGIQPPSPPNTGGAVRPNIGTFAPFVGKSAAGAWTLLVSDDDLSDPNDSDFPDTTGTLTGWKLEVCIDNGQPATPPPTPTPTSTAPPQPVNGTPIPTAAPASPTPTPTAAPTSCIAAADPFEPDDAFGAAQAFDQANLTSRSRTFDRATDADWTTFQARASQVYAFTANLMGQNPGVTLSIFGTDGSTLVKSGADTVGFTAPADGQYYLRAKSSAGIASPCSASYTVGLVVTNPAIGPAPTPVGPPLPPGYNRPPVSAAVLEPVDTTVMTQMLPISVLVGLNSESGIGSAQLFANGLSVGQYAAPGGPPLGVAPARLELAPAVVTDDELWPLNWTPPGAGAYMLSAVITATNGMTATSPASQLYVDLLPPTVTMAAEDITLAKLADDGSYELQGTAADDSAVDRVEVRLDGGPWAKAVLTGTNWTYAVPPLAQANPDGGNLSIDTRVTDKAGRTAATSASVLLDVVPPATFPITTTVTGGAVITPSQVITQLNPALSWPAVAGATQVYAGWTSSPTPALPSLTAYGPGAGAHYAILSEGNARYAHVVAVDAAGNQTAISRGPYFFDTAATPDVIGDVTFADWINAGGKQVGQMTTGNAPTAKQKLYAGWNASQLRLRWEGVDTANSGDLYLYLGTGGPGTTDLYNPYGPSQPGALPFAADYLVRVTGGITPTLYSFSGGTWVMKTLVAAQRSGELTDLLLSFADLGISDPAAATLNALGVASKPDVLDVWATIPDRNLGRTWKQYIRFASVGAGIAPGDGVWADAQVEVKVSADPPPSKLLGPGDAVTVTVTALNSGSAALPSLTVNGATSGGVSLSNAPRTAINIAAGSATALTLNGTVSADGTIALTLADTYHRPYSLETLSYGVDSAAPISVSVTMNDAAPFNNTAVGFAKDDSALSAFELEVTGASGAQVVQCAVNGQSTGKYPCEWNAGNAADGATFTLRGRATDEHGNASDWSDPISVIVDATPPALALSPASLAALSDRRLNAQELLLDGALTDNRAADRVELCSDAAAAACDVRQVLTDATWTAAAPALGDGITTTLAFIGYDVAGNVSAVFTRTVSVDSVPPALGQTTLNTTVFSGPTPTLFAYGTATDGGGIGSVSLLVLKPDGSSVVAPGAVNGANWSADVIFDQVGSYQALVIATDQAGNQTRQLLAGTVTASSGSSAPQTPVVTITAAGGTVHLTWPHVTQDQSGNPINVTAYRVYRSDNGTFTPPVLWQTLAGPFGATISIQDASPYSPGLTAYKVVPMTNANGTAAGPASGPVGSFRFNMEAGD